MENIFLVIIALGAAYYLYIKLFKSSGCNCGNGKNSCKTDKK
ncbi:FeoB-associated Cys-rich membrane protein [Aliarcobacter vitoriensis]|uniref:FeoB-associated Cys-rich membrane protein n=1 Tax=Aliarcobacter vitoriensis TaxID=2011099 RepID=A0A366MTU3_9BACT|nr:FeoB-associated Cys-rich membrane protein [Aliarcobacter vitoriensis]RBQ29676.1 FeoB-associated Cys-rich membrane protein [Aliarcobacter vitoriensis]RBQ30603.1 FeoB-associated Cys-rich membrane protein [Arcobacter sp. FW59]